MAEDIKTSVENFNTDAQTAEEVVNGNESGKVVARLGREYLTLPAAIQRILDMGGMDAFATEAALKASIPATSTKIAYAADTQKIWRWARTSEEGVTPITGTWTDTGKSPVDQAKADATTKANAAEANAKAYFTNNGTARILAIATSNINYSTTDRTLTFSNSISIIAATAVYTVATPQTVSLPSNTIYRIEFNTSTKAMRAVAYNAAKTENWLVCGTVTVSTYGIVTNDFEFTVNGANSTKFEIGKIVTNTNLTVDLNIESGFLVFRPNGRIVSNSISIATPTASVALPTTNGVYRVDYNAYANTFEINATSTAQRTGYVFVATLVRTSATNYSLFGVDIYTINGADPASFVNPNGNIGQLSPTAASDIAFDFVAKTLTVTNQRVRYTRNGATRLLSAQVLDISANPTVWNFLVVTKDNVLAARPVNAALQAGDIIVGQYRLSDLTISGIPLYTLQGKVSEVKSSLRYSDFIIPFGNLEPDYEQPELPAYNAMWSANNGDYTKIYALYDALMTANPDYITRTLLGNESTGKPIYEYRFTTPDVPSQSSASPHYKPKILIMSGMHGGEKAGIYNTYFCMKEIINRWKEDDHLAALYWGIDFRIVPLANPWGYNANSRYNSNGVDLARNFPADWSTALENGGAGPLSEAETVILNNWMAANSDALYMCSHHNFGDNTSNFIWNASPSRFSRSLAKALIIGQTIRTKKRYAWMPQTNDYYVGYTDLGQPGGSEGRQAVDQYGMNGSTFEISASFAWEAGMPAFSSAVATIGAEAFINWLLMNVKYAPQLYNTRINL
ncbi:M14 family zinc carboxypeptidase [Acinetobacter radioresistens]|uniref:M14 family zinc carboxypeptidase n=1 Tax=Acinetobacter radioresistens TaxID=40216 RepID=UPI000CC8446C|nr:M14 family zinc carboxypeptidase [Acinetobacter radioresistens]PKH28787.1 hypothetical protein BJF94_12600 [Acinetobacter radioresistens]